MCFFSPDLELQIFRRDRDYGFFSYPCFDILSLSWAFLKAIVDVVSSQSLKVTIFRDSLNIDSQAKLVSEGSKKKVTMRRKTSFRIKMSWAGAKLNVSSR